MADHRYENHFDISRDKICPFKLMLVKDYYDYGCNWHSNIEIIMIVRGSGNIRYDNEEWHFSCGDIIIVNSDSLHRLYSKTGLDYYYLIIDERFCNENGITTYNKRFKKLFRSEQTVKLFENVVSAMNNYNSQKENLDFLNASKVRLGVLALLIDICENHLENGFSKSKSEKPSDEYVKKVVTYMGEHYNEAVTLEKLAKICGITKHHLAREFKRYTGETVLTYLNIMRCKNASVFMEEGMSVTEAAYECGFESVSYFSRTYKKIMGKAPSKSRKGNNP